MSAKGFVTVFTTKRPGPPAKMSMSPVIAVENLTFSSTAAPCDCAEVKMIFFVWFGVVASTQIRSGRSCPK